MDYLQNLHTHTTYCDGKHTPREIVEIAIEKGFESIGFSGHSYMYFSSGRSMTPERCEEYKKEITQLKEEYKNKFGIYLGLEMEMYSQVDLSSYDYLIGSCHYLKIGENYVGFDRSAEVVREVIDTYFGGDGLAFAKEYYRQFSTITNYGNFDILGHFDLITKNIEIEKFFDTDSKEYLSAAIECAETLVGKIPLFEVNTGAISRGYRSVPYPAIPLIKELKRLGFGAIISSDCHDATKLDCGFDQAREILLHCGYTEHYLLTDSGFKGSKL